MEMGMEQDEDWDVELPAEDDVSESNQSHHKLLNAVSQLYNKQRVGAPKRREPAAQISEFHLSTTAGTEEESRSRKRKKALVSVKQLTRPLLDKPLHKHIPDKIKSLSLFMGPNKTLDPPVEKVHADKAIRAVGFNKVKETLTRWDAIVQRNRAADQLSYPLVKHEQVKKDPADFLKTFKNPTELELQMESILKGSAVIQEEKKAQEDLYPLSVEEMVEKRKMMAKIRAQESYRIAKAARQNKIKSKKYHRILRQERTKEELRSFEALKETDPEAALEKLQQLDRARAEERASLRHKNTGHWARSRTIRAKYDKDARIELAEQLAKSRELTRKLKSMDSSSEEDNAEEDGELEEGIGNATEQRNKGGEEAENNPWVSNHQDGAEIQEFVQGFKQYCDMKKSRKMEEEAERKRRESLPKIKKPPLCPDESSDEGDETKIRKNGEQELFSEDECLNKDLTGSVSEPQEEEEAVKNILSKNVDSDDASDSEKDSEIFPSNEQECDSNRVKEPDCEKSENRILDIEDNDNEGPIGSENGIQETDDSKSATVLAKNESIFLVNRRTSDSEVDDNTSSEEEIQSEQNGRIEEAESNENEIVPDEAEPEDIEVVTNRGSSFVVSCSENLDRTWEPSPKSARKKRCSSLSFQEEILNTSGLWKVDSTSDEPNSGDTEEKVGKCKRSGDFGNEISVGERNRSANETSKLGKDSVINESEKLKKEEVVESDKGKCYSSTKRAKKLKKDSENEVVIESDEDEDSKCNSSTKKLRMDSENELKTGEEKSKKDIGTIEDIFKNVEYLLEKAAGEKIRSLKRDMAAREKNQRRREDEGERSEEDEPYDKLAMKKKSKLSSEIDEAMIEMADDRVSNVRSVDVHRLLAVSEGLTGEPASKPKAEDIDPETFLKMKPKLLATQIPELVTEGGGDEALDDPEDEELGEEHKRRMNLAEAFADDDVVDQFRKEKDDEIKESQPESIDLSLPGWGSWGGASMPTTRWVSKRKRRQFILKPPQEIRRDRNRPNIIITERGNQKIRQHMVSELPGPFKSVKEFEASVRAPLGSTWVPETAHDRLTALPVVTKMGTIIQPMDESQLVGAPHRRNYRKGDHKKKPPEELPSENSKTDSK